MPWWKWSKTAATNSSSDPSINWAEGQAPSTVNDSARAMMAESAKWRDDISATLTTSGSSSAYLLSTNSVYDSLTHLDRALLAFFPHATNTSDVQTTLAVDGLGAKPIRFAQGVEITAGTLTVASPYIVVYDDGDGAFYLLNQIGGTPVGSMVANAGTVLPAGWLWCDGAEVSRTTYARLYAVISIQWGAGDTTTTFNLPDMSGNSFPVGNATIPSTAGTQTGAFLSVSGIISVFPSQVNWMIKY